MGFFSRWASFRDEIFDITFANSRGGLLFKKNAANIGIDDYKTISKMGFSSRFRPLGFFSSFYGILAKYAYTCSHTLLQFRLQCFFPLFRYVEKCQKPPKIAKIDEKQDRKESRSQRHKRVRLLTSASNPGSSHSDVING